MYQTQAKTIQLPNFREGGIGGRGLDSFPESNLSLHGLSGRDRIHQLRSLAFQRDTNGRYINPDPRQFHMRGLTPLPKDTGELFDRTVVRIGRERLVLVDDLLSLGLTNPVANPMGTLTVYSEKISHPGYAKVTMDPGAGEEYSQADRSGVTLPFPCVWDSFSYGIRWLEAAALTGQPLQTDHLEAANRNVLEGLEDLAWNGFDLAIDGNSQTGVLDAPNVGTQAYVDNEAWTADGHSGQDILDDVLNMVDTAQSAKKYGPYYLYVNTTYGNELNKNFGDGVTTFDITIRQRLEQLVYNGQNLRVRIADKLPANRTALIQMTSDVIRIHDGQRPTVVPWRSASSFVSYWLVMAFMVPETRDDYDGNSGIVTGNTT